MPVNIRNLPWSELKRLFYQFRQRFFSKPRPERVHLETDADLDTVREELGSLFPLISQASEEMGFVGGFGFTNGWEISYRYYGEDLNMRIPVRLDDDYRWYQLHIRGFEGAGIELENWLDVHLELEPSEYPEGHLNGVNYRVSKAIGMFEAELADSLVFDTRRVKP